MELEKAVPSADVSGIAADFTDADQVRGLLEALGEVDILVNNVGVFEISGFRGDLRRRLAQRYLDVNLMSGSACRGTRCRHAGPRLGRIIFVSSESGVNVPPPT